MNKLIVCILLVIPVFSSGSDSERITYNLKLGFIKGGEAKIDITDTTYKGEKAIHYRMEAKTTGLADALYKVYDIYESTANRETLLPYISIRNVQEKKYKYYNKVTYYRDIDSIYSQRSGWKVAPKNLLDILTVFFYFTKEHYIDKIDKGEIVSLPTMHADEINTIDIKFLGFETISTKFGDMECYVLSPQVKKGKLLKKSDGVKFYITRETKIPVLLEFEMKVGSLRAVLQEYDTEKL